ncbi:MAG: alkaline phosphatase family protein, partial [Myxococcota bacterium]
ISPAMPISEPASYAEELAADIGRYYTQGMPEDTKALASGLFDDAEFLSQSEQVFAERLALLDRELARYEGGVLFFYFSSLDQLSHVFWRSIEPDASPEDARYAHVIPDIYQRIDEQVGRVLAYARERGNTEVIIMSDHGFSPYRYKVNLNTWLVENSYMTVYSQDEVEARQAEGLDDNIDTALRHINWEQTTAYALGLNQLFINLKGRESRGAVDESEYDALVSQLKRSLESIRDPNTGQTVITEAVRPEMGRFAERAPDLLIGFNRTYRSSDLSALGQPVEEVISRNTGTWSGDHCMHPVHVPGVLLTTRPLDPDQWPKNRMPNLLDLAPTILSHFGAPVPEEMTGTPLWIMAAPESGGQQPASPTDN